MYGRCQALDSCTALATHKVQFEGQPKDPLYTCPECSDRYPRYAVEPISAGKH